MNIFCCWATHHLHIQSSKSPNDVSKHGVYFVSVIKANYCFSYAHLDAYIFYLASWILVHLVLYRFYCSGWHISFQVIYIYYGVIFTEIMWTHTVFKFRWASSLYVNRSLKCKSVVIYYYCCILLHSYLPISLC